MNGGADLGGMHGFGPVVEEANETNFHADWEARVMAMVIACGPLKQWNLDQSRFARESLLPPVYQTTPYYGIWLQALEHLLLERGMVSADELSDGEPRTPAIETPGPLAASDVEMVLRRGGPVDREAAGEQRYSVGDRVTTINDHPASHTRLPRYARGRTGEIVAVLGCHVFPDTNARGEGEDPQWLYGVRFAATELWGRDGDPRDSVTLDMWEPYLVG